MAVFSHIKITKHTLSLLVQKITVKTCSVFKRKHYYSINVCVLQQVKYKVIRFLNAYFLSILIFYMK